MKNLFDPTMADLDFALVHTERTAKKKKKNLNGSAIKRGNNIFWGTFKVPTVIKLGGGGSGLNDTAIKKTFFAACLREGINKTIFCGHVRKWGGQD